MESPEAMEQHGGDFARGTMPGTTIALIGGLGAGKTHWTKGLVRGLGSAAEVTSPTFGLLHEYTDGRLPIYHLDFYRITSAAELEALGWDELLDQDAVIVAEWADKFPEMMPADTRWLHFTVETDGSRTLREEVN